jgi:hypothetical protein
VLEFTRYRYTPYRYMMEVGMSGISLSLNLSGLRKEDGDEAMERDLIIIGAGRRASPRDSTQDAPNSDRW